MRAHLGRKDHEHGEQMRQRRQEARGDERVQHRGTLLWVCAACFARLRCVTRRTTARTAAATAATAVFRDGEQQQRRPKIAISSAFFITAMLTIRLPLPISLGVPNRSAPSVCRQLLPLLSLLPVSLQRSCLQTSQTLQRNRACRHDGARPARPRVRTSATMRARNRSARARPIVAPTRAREATRLAPPNAPRHMARPPDPVAHFLVPPAERGRREGGLRAVRPCRLRCGHLPPLGTPTARAPWTKSPPWPPLCIIRRCAANNALHGALLSPSEVPVPRGEMAHSHTHSPATPQARSRSTTLARWCARSGSTRRRVTCPVPVAARRTSRRCRRSSRSWTSQSRPSRTSSPR